MTIKLNTVIIATSDLAVTLSPDSTAKYIASGIVWVCSGMFPATIRVAPNSPSALAKESTKPATMPGQARGSVMVKIS